MTVCIDSDNRDLFVVYSRREQVNQPTRKESGWPAYLLNTKHREFLADIQPGFLTASDAALVVMGRPARSLFRDRAPVAR